MNRNSFKGIDCFRFIAAILIITIHTSPLLTYTETGDFILTRIIARVAVPFFFMTSGYFLISRHARNTDKLISFVKRTAVIYGVAIVLYIPINIYNRYFSVPDLLPKIIKDIVFDGTMYHLWYLPASIVGGMIAWCLVRKLGFNKALIITAALYIVGMFGDSYYGIIENVPMIKNIYEQIFLVSDYTRNGIFFTPVFFVLGGMIANRPVGLTLTKNIIGFGVSLTLMFGEALVLHYFDLQRHDSMYIFLLPCMFFLFNILLSWKGSRMVRLRNTSLVIYIIHPMMIVATRLFAKIVGLEAIFIDNSVIHFLAVCAESVAFSFVYVFVTEKLKSRKAALPANTDRAWIEIDLENLKHNVNVIKDALPEKCEIMAITKAQAYGHGAYEVASYLNSIGVKAFAVATLDEGINLRKYGIEGDILVLGYTDPCRAKDIRRYDIIQTIVDLTHAEKLNAQNVRIKAHVKIDSGMHRLGVEADKVEDIEQIFSMKYINVCGMFTHLCVADSLEPDDVAFTEGQIDKFFRLVDKLREDGINVGKLHAQNSSGIINYPNLDCDYARPGVVLYGVKSSVDDGEKIPLDVRPVLSLKTRVTLIRHVKKGESVGYGRAFVAERDSVVAMLSVGYGDGVPRSLSGGKGSVQVNGHIAPIAGRVCMDQMAVDVTDIPDVCVGDIATVISTDLNSGITAPEVACNSGSISNELLSKMGSRLNVVKH